MAAKNQTNFPPAESLEKYDALLASVPGIEKKGKTTPYTSTNGYMFSFLTKEGSIGLRLSQKYQLVFKDKYKCEQMVQHGRTMKDFVEIPFELLADTALLTPYLKLSMDFTSSLKPK